MKEVYQFEKTVSNSLNIFLIFYSLVILVWIVVYR